MSETPKLERGLGLVQATSLNITFMVGIGPFVVIPLVIKAMGGPGSLIAWVAGAVLASADGCIWAELGAAMPEAGGSYVYLRRAYGAERWGKLFSFLYIWQTLFQGPLSIASGALGFADYSRYLTPRWQGVNRLVGALGSHSSNVVAAIVVLLVVVLLYRRIEEIGRISVIFSVVVIATILWIVWGGATHFNPQQIFGSTAAHPKVSWIFFAALGHATVQTAYSYLGYYNVCNLGGEMQNPERNIPRAIFISIAAITVLYLAMQTSILSVIPWREAANSTHIASTFIERLYGSDWALLATGLILLTALGSVFAATLGYSRVPYAAAADGNFISIFARLHNTKRFPYVSLLALGGAAIVFCSLLQLSQAIRGILAMRCIIQFVDQAIGLVLLRRRWASGKLPFRMWAYPLPVMIAVAGWLALFLATGPKPMLASLAAVLAGVFTYLVRARWLHQWPFAGAFQEIA